MHLGGFVDGQRTYLQTPGASTRGTLVTTGTSTNFGSWTSLGTMPDFCFEGLTVFLASQSAAVNCLAVDIATDASGTTPKIIEGLVWCNSKSSSVGAGNSMFNVPVHIPAGVTLYARSRCTAATAVSTNVCVSGYSQGFGMPGYSRMQNITSDALITNVSMSGNTANTVSWCSFSTAANSYSGFLIAEQFATGARAGTSTQHELLIGHGFMSPTYVQPLGALMTYGNTDVPTKAKQVWYFPSSSMQSGLETYWLGLRSQSSEIFGFAVYGLV